MDEYKNTFTIPNLYISDSPLYENSYIRRNSIFKHVFIMSQFRGTSNHTKLTSILIKYQDATINSYLIRYLYCKSTRSFYPRGTCGGHMCSSICTLYRFIEQMHIFNKSLNFTNNKLSKIRIHMLLTTGRYLNS